MADLLPSDVNPIPFHQAWLDFERLLAQLPAVIFQTNARHEIDRIYGQGLDWLPFTDTELAGKPITQLTGLLKEFQIDLEAKGLQTFEGRLSDGVRWHGFVLATERGELLGYLWLQAHAERRGPEQLSLLSYFIKHAPAAVAMFDREMRYLMVSDHWMEVYGLRESVLGRTHYEVFPEIPPRWRRTHQRCLLGVIESCEADPFPRKDGSTDYINWVVAPWYEAGDEVGGLIFYTENVNEQVEARQRLLQLNQELRRSNERLADFASAVSHTLREPLSLTIALGQQLVHDLEHTDHLRLVNQAEEWLNHLYRMESIIAGLLDNAQLSDTASAHTVVLDDLLHQVLANLQPLIEARQVHIHQGRLPEIVGNEFELLALFQQLIVNGIAYNEATPPEVVIAAERVSEGWCFRVSDNGVGLTEAQCEALFHFGRERDLTHPRGHGVGLPVCQRIVTRMGGRMWVESAPKQGTTFYFLLPLA